MRKLAVVRLVLAAALFAGWVGWLAYQAWPLWGPRPEPVAAKVIKTPFYKRQA